MRASLYFYVTNRWNPIGREEISDEENCRLNEEIGHVGDNESNCDHKQSARDQFLLVCRCVQPLSGRFLGLKIGDRAALTHY